MRTRLLNEDEFKATLVPTMQDVSEGETDVLDIWPYVNSIPSSDLKSYLIYDDFVEKIYRTGDGCFDHVLVMTRTKNVYVDVVVDLVHSSIYGHRLLDLNKEYGLS
ncbi:MAG: hypothetical protein U0798_14110 [Gemmataceae bacterium]